MTRARRSTGASVISSPIPMACCSLSWFTRPGSRIATGAPALFALLRKSAPRLRHVFADGAYAGEKLRGALEEIGKWTIEIIKRCPGVKGFEVLPRRWVVERTFAWLGRCRRLAKDFEGTLESAVAWITIASIQLLTRRLARALKTLDSFRVGLIEHDALPAHRISCTDCSSLSSRGECVARFQPYAGNPVEGMEMITAAPKNGASSAAVATSPKPARVAR